MIDRPTPMEQLHTKALSFWPILLFGLVFKFGAGLHYTLLSTLGERVFPLWVAGFIISAGSLIQMVGDVPAGMLLDRYGYVRLLRIFTIVFIAGGSVLFFGLTPLTFVLTVLLGTLGWLFYGPGVNAYILAEAPHSIAGRTMGLMHSFQSAGVVLASIVFPFLLSRSVPNIGVVVACILVIALIVLLNARPESASVHTVAKTPRHHYYIRRHFLSDVVRAMRRLNPASFMLVTQGFAGAVFYGMIWFTVPLAIAEGAAHGLPGASLGIFDLAVVLLGAFFGKLADKMKKSTLVIVGLFVFSAAGALLGFNLNLLFLLLGFIATAGDELSNVSLWAWLDTLDADHAQDGLVNGAITFFEDLGWAIGPALAGLLYGIIGPSGVIMTGATVLFLAWIASLFLLRHPSARHVGAVVRDHIPRRHVHKR